MRIVILLWTLFFLAMVAQTQSTIGGYSMPDFQCKAGQFVTGFKDGKPTCGIVRLPAMATRPRGYGN